MKYIHYVHFSSKPGGIELSIVNILSLLKSKLAVSIYVLRPAKPNDFNVYRDSGFFVTYGKEGYRTYLKFFKYAQKNKLEIFHLFNAGPIILILARLAGVKHLVYSIRGTKYFCSFLKKIFLKPIWKLALRKSYLITSNSIYSGDVFKREVYKKKQIYLLYNPINTVRFSLKNDHTSSKLIRKIIYTGRLANGKNLTKWIDVAYHLLKEDSNYQFEIYGDGPIRKNLEENVLSEYKKDILFKGYTSNIETAFKEADLLLFLSEYESFGNVVIESVLCGTPVLCSNIPVMYEIFEEAPEFIIDMQGDINAQVLDRLQNLEKLKEKALYLAPKFAEKFGHQQHLDKLIEIYNSFD